MKNEGRFYLSYEKENGDEYSVSREVKLPSDYVLLTDEGKAEILAQLANALLRNMGIGEDVQLNVHVNNLCTISSSRINTRTITTCCTSSAING